MKTIKENWKALLGELLGSMFVSFWGLGLLIPFVVTGSLSNMYEFAFWFGIIFAITVIAFAPISGVHVNPGVTVAWAIFGKFNKKLVVPYWICQIIGWGLGVAFIYLIYANKLDAWALETGGNPAELFYCSYPAGETFAAFGLEVATTLLLTFGIFVFLDERIPNKPSKQLFPLAIGFVVAIDIAFAGGFSGACINTARDLGPRIVGLLYGLIKGYDVSNVFGNWQWIVYIVAPLIGAVLGGVLHYFVIIKLLKKEK